jgi:hypothetical protein
MVEVEVTNPDLALAGEKYKPVPVGQTSFTINFTMPEVGSFL